MHRIGRTGRAGKTGTEEITASQMHHMDAALVAKYTCSELQAEQLFALTTCQCRQYDAICCCMHQFDRSLAAVQAVPTLFSAARRTSRGQGS